jgi:coenzyme F420 hydrogenase subunit beta
MAPSEAEQLFATVIANGYCIGCGSCTQPVDSPFEIQWDQFGKLVAVPVADLSTCTAQVLSVCPFSERSTSEDAIAERVFGSSMQYLDGVGFYRECYVGHVVDPARRQLGSSGGIGKWLTGELLSRGIVDCVYQLRGQAANSADDRLFDYAAFRSPDDVWGASRSAYYPVSLDHVLSTIRAVPGRYAVTALPCFSKSIRQLQETDAVLKERIRLVIGLICGSLKSRSYASMIAWQQGIQPGDLSTIDFRGKYPDRPANHKKTIVASRSGNVRYERSSKELFGTDYGMGFFKPLACDFCDDVVAETADVSVGDAWRPEYVADSRGHSIVVVRNPIIRDVILGGAASGMVDVHRIPATEVVESQRAGLRHRREGLSHRLAQSVEQGQWVPPKRVAAGSIRMSSTRRRLYELRSRISALSHRAFASAVRANSYERFRKEMQPLAAAHRRLYRKPVPVRLLQHIIGMARRMLRRPVA